MYKQANKDLWTGRVDSETDSSQFRHFQTIELKDINETKFDRKLGTGILGYAVDKGVELNNGRVGAQEGPDAIRKAFANLSVLSPCPVYDYGNVYHNHDALIETQEEYADLASKMFGNHNYSLLVGGGHDIAYAQYLAMRKSYPDASIGVINIDAHFDTREAESSTSGTSFRQILEEDDNAHYFVLGIQPASNTKHLFDYADKRGIEYVTVDEILHEISPTIKDKLDHFINKHDVIMLTICMDVVDSAFAPGVSAPAVNGLTPHIILELTRRVIGHEKLISVSIAETNPLHDVDNRTAKLVALLLHNFIH